MNREDIIRIAHESHLDVYGLGTDYAKFADALERFASLVAKNDTSQERVDETSESVHESVAHSVVAGALFDFMGWLTSRNKRMTLSGADEASPAVEAIQEFSEKRGLSLKDAEVGFWTEFLSSPPQRKPLSDEEIEKIAKPFWDGHLGYGYADFDSFGFARAIEAKLN